MEVNAVTFCGGDDADTSLVIGSSFCCNYRSDVYACDLADCLVEFTSPSDECGAGPEAVARIVQNEVFGDFCHANDPYQERNFRPFETLPLFHPQPTFSRSAVRRATTGHSAYSISASIWTVTLPLAYASRRLPGARAASDARDAGRGGNASRQSHRNRVWRAAARTP